VQAYAGMVLARSQQAPLGALRSLFERRTDARSGLPLVQLSIALQKMGDQPRADQALVAGLAWPGLAWPRRAKPMNGWRTTAARCATRR